MKAWCAGNGQIHNMAMISTANTMDCMHDAQIILRSATPLGGGSRQPSQQATGKEQEQEMETSENSSATEGMKYVLRRLTPLECLRLQGLPDWWVDGAEGSDSAIYKMCGNGLAIPCAYDVMRRIAEELRKEEKANG